MFVNENGFDSEEYRRFERARPYKLRKNSDSPRFWEGTTTQAAERIAFRKKGIALFRIRVSL
jgi:hypothetical protein